MERNYIRCAVVADVEYQIASDHVGIFPCHPRLLVVMAEMENRIVVNQRHTKFLEPALAA
jgi:hypothetical protein